MGIVWLGLVSRSPEWYESFYHNFTSFCPKNAHTNKKLSNYDPKFQGLYLGNRGAPEGFFRPCDLACFPGDFPTSAINFSDL